MSRSRIWSGDNDKGGRILPKKILKSAFISDMRVQKPPKLKSKKKRKRKNISYISTKLGLRKFKITKLTIY